jgi:hypothetical protein
MFVNKFREDVNAEQHNASGKNHRNNLNRHDLDHADRGNDGVERENDIQNKDLKENCVEARRGVDRVSMLVSFHFVVDLARRFRDEKETTDDENDVLSRDCNRSNLEKWMFKQTRDPKESTEEDEP